MEKKFKQIYTIELLTKEEYIDRSTEIQTALEENPVFKETEIDVDLQSEEKAEDDEDEEWDCQKCGHKGMKSEYLEDGGCPKCGN